MASLLRLAAIALLLFSGCKVNTAPSTPEEGCVLACKAKDKQCSEHECEVGCSLSLDRLIEREQDTVIACVASKTTCTDSVWSHCASRVGPHIDGGPPAPPPPPDEE